MGGREQVTTGRLFAGVHLRLHWSWFLVAIIEIQYRKGMYSSVAWNVAEYLALFAIVLTHEFGHALACRQVGGVANQILLWPFGGVAYVDPPQRPGAMLWSIAAGPLVNVVLAPILFVAVLMFGPRGADNPTDFSLFVQQVLYIDIGLLVFNILPVYPLDGGQILRSLLWFPLGRARSLMAAAVIGLIGGVGLIGYAVWSSDLWLGLITAYLLMNCWTGLQAAKRMRVLEKLPQREGFRCPSCGTAPPLGQFWKCRQCAQAFDTFAGRTICPHCGTQHDATTCIHCRRQYPFDQWTVGARHADQGFVSGSFASK